MKSYFWATLEYHTEEYNESNNLLNQPIISISGTIKMTVQI